MDLRNQEANTEREAPEDTRCCHKCKMTACFAVTLTTVILIMGLLLCLGLFVWWTKAPQEDEQTFKPAVSQYRDSLQRCRKERSDLTLMLHAATEDSRCRLCPDDWLWWNGSCYFFSVGRQENLKWNDSAEFCQQNNSSLTVITGSAEMEFIQSVMRTFPKFPFLWVGLTDAQQESQWMWWDGTHVQHYMSLTVEWDADYRDCADLRGGGSLFAADCEEYGPWTCKKDS